MNIVIIGQGAIGLLWYFKLSQQPENNVSIQCSARINNAPNQLLFIDTAKQEHQQRLQFTNEFDFQQADLVIYCLKAYAIKDAQQKYRPIINKKAIIIYSHNGLLALDTPLNQSPEYLLSSQTEISMLMTHGSLKTNDFQIVHTGAGQTDIGLIQGDISQDQIDKLIKVLNTALPRVSWQNNIKEKQWLKLAINCVINPLTAIHNCDNGSIKSEVFQQEISGLLQEIITVAEKNNLILLLEELTKTVLMVAENTASNCSSMRSDILANRKTEIDHINGFIHQQGVKHHVATPYNTSLWQQIKKLEAE